ncbi:glutathionylspermidine synthase family protein [Streptacidiphilus rugosus]|uniref:glutathionylspermidine synthase family protein n=1 Tax=Streptacidiphilus rugosus TaxID=405783 RepID=UPI00055F3F21|nr:glutathionylspermidine synthase family protein [Streptacidiphilus rugosus]
MRRHTITPRPDWQRIVEEQGLVYPLTRFPDDSLRPYWDESAYYSFTLPEVEALEETVAELHELCLQAADHIVEQNRLGELGITDPTLAALVRRSWRRRDEQPSLYGRFDLRYDGTGPAKLLEYNADTPTSLLEAAGPQWFWMEDRFPGADQWNSLHERLVDAWRRQAALLAPGPVHFAHSSADALGEDQLTCAYLLETAQQAGLTTVPIAVEDIGWDSLSGRFVDEQLRFMRTVFKLYPWEWLASDAFGGHVIDTADLGGGTGGTCWIEPPWKMLLSNKALLAVLWELNPGHPNLLPARLDGPGPMRRYVAKPLLGREGAGVLIGGADGAPGPVPLDPGERYCWQEFAPLPDFEGNRTVLGAWVVDGEPAGLGIRESAGLVTDEYARFVPHLIVDSAG